MKKWCVGFASFATVTVAMTACDPGSAAPATTVAPVSTSVAIAAPTETDTTPPPPTTLEPRTTSTSVGATTSIVPTPAETAEVEIAATLDALNNDVYTCFGSPDTCDVDQLLDRYFASTDEVVRPIFRDVWNDLEESGRVKIYQNRIQRNTQWVTSDPSGMTGTTYHCEQDSTYNVPAGTVDTAVPAGFRASYLRFYYEWQRLPDGRWIVTRSELGSGWEPDTIDFGELPSLTESDLAACF